MRLIDADALISSKNAVCKACVGLDLEKLLNDYAPTVNQEEIVLNWIEKIAIRMGESQGCWISCLECEGINCSAGSVIKEIYEIVKDGEENATNR